MNRLAKSIPFWFFVLIFSCSAPQLDRSTYADQVKKAEDALYGDNKTFQMAPDKVDTLLNAYTSFAELFPKDSSSPDYLLKAADLQRFARNSNAALELYKQIYDTYPDFEKRAYCLFLQGFVYENDLADLPKAESTYKAFLEEYADHELADDVTFSLKNLGKSPEDIIKEFEMKNLEESADQAEPAS